MSQGIPAKCTGIMALVDGVISFSMFSGTIFKVFLSISARIGFAPTKRIVFIVAANVIGVVITSSPGPISRAIRAK